MTDTLSGNVGCPPKRSSKYGIDTLAWVTVCGIVLTANSVLLVLQIIAGRLLVPFIGSCLETWTAIIGMFLLGIAAGNAVGGRLADRHSSPRWLSLYLVLGSVASLWMLALPWVLMTTGWHHFLPLALRTIVLAALECFPPGFSLSLLTPLAFKIGMGNESKYGLTAGIVFAMGTLGCLIGNYLTGFVLMPRFPVSCISLYAAGMLLICAGVSWLLPHHPDSTSSSHKPALPIQENTKPLLGRKRACLIVFICSCGGMILELVASRILAQVVGVSLYTWTGVIGVMLAGTALGNYLGGWLADRGGGLPMLTRSLLFSSLATLCVLAGFFPLNSSQAFASFGLITQIIFWTFTLFFVPMLLLGSVSPQVIRAAVPNVGSAGSTAGQIYAWSTCGAILGTFAAGYWVISGLGMYRTTLVVALMAALVTGLIPLAWSRRGTRNTVAMLLGLILAGCIVINPSSTKIALETNYFTIRVDESVEHPDVLRLHQDKLVHSFVKLDDPTYLHYPHENIQMDFLNTLAERLQRPSILVIGGGGYTLPRAGKTVHPHLNMEVVEIDPGVTAVSYSHLGLDHKLNIHSHHCDGRHFIVEQARASSYHLIVLDAVNDLSVPSHLLTSEFNEGVKKTLTADGVYLVTLIDNPRQGKLWKSVHHTLAQTFQHVELLTYSKEWDPEATTLQILYASDQMLDLEQLRTATQRQSSGKSASKTYRPPTAIVNGLLKMDTPLILTDDYAPVESMMLVNFRIRGGK